MQDRIEGEPFLVLLNQEWADDAGRQDVLVLSISTDDEGVHLELPQFGIESHHGSNPSTALEDVLHQVLAFYAALRELPEEYINEVEDIQRDLIERLFLPWWGMQLAKNPQYWTVPPNVVTMASHAGPRVPA